MISSDIMRGYNDIIILSILNSEDNYGYAISQTIEKISEGNYTIKETTLYSALNRLEKKGYILSYDGTKTFGRARTYFKITELGKIYLREKVEEWKLTREVINNFMEEYNG